MIFKKGENSVGIVFYFLEIRKVGRRNKSGYQGKSQQIVAQRLLSCLQHLVTSKSSANDLSLPIFEITIDPQEPFTAVESSYVIRKTYLYPCILEAVRNIAYPAWIPA